MSNALGFPPRHCAKCSQPIITTWPPTEHVCHFVPRQDFDTWWFRQRKIVVGTDKRALARAAYDASASTQQEEIESLRAQLTTLTAKLAEAEKDAARLSHVLYTLDRDAIDEWYRLSPTADLDEFRAAIDAALA